MKALSIKQPWASLICAGIKDVENRTWYTNFCGRIYIHAGKDRDKSAYDMSHFIELGNINTQQVGCIIGEVDVINCLFRFGGERDYLYSTWHEVGMYGFVLKNPIAYDNPIPYKGRLGFFEVEL
jgi:hypothetical protein